MSTNELQQTGAQRPDGGSVDSAARARRVDDYEEIKPLLDLCKAGKLFEVQDWIAGGNPVNPPPVPNRGRRGKSPLEVAIEVGFHSLVKTLLEAGAVIEPDGWDSPMNKALKQRRLDLVALLVEHGFNPQAVDMERVFDSWDPEIMVYFIDRRAEVESCRAFAYAFCNRIRTALRVYKQNVERLPSLQEQANIALRHHCKDGNLKWVGLMLWAGADPYKPGPDSYDSEPCEEDEGLCALGYAALYDHYDVFDMSPIRTRPISPQANRFIFYMCRGRGLDYLKKLLENGLDPNDAETGGCSAIRSCLNHMGWGYRVNRFDSWQRDPPPRNIDTEECRDTMKAIHLLAKHGAKWAPGDRREVNDARRSLLKLAPDYAIEFVWIMSKYNACSRDAAQQLLSTSTIKRHTSAHQKRVQEIMSAWS